MTICLSQRLSVIFLAELVRPVIESIANLAGVISGHLTFRIVGLLAHVSKVVIQVIQLMETLTRFVSSVMHHVLNVLITLRLAIKRDVFLVH